MMSVFACAADKRNASPPGMGPFLVGITATAVGLGITMPKAWFSVNA